MSRYEFAGPWTWNTPKKGTQSAVVAPSHQQVVTHLLTQIAAAKGGTLLVLGAGPCNDLNLRTLADHFARILLVDLDQQATEQGVANQGLAGHAALDLVGGVDLMGILDDLTQIPVGGGVDETAVAALMERGARFQWSMIPGQFDLVASTALLSQMINSIVERLPAENPAVLQLIQTVRRRHLQLMIDACRPGGSCLMIFDFVSSVTLPDLGRHFGESLRDLLSHAIANKNFFHGMNPVVINRMLVDDPDLASRIRNPQTFHPWVWDAGPRQYAMTAVQFEVATGDNMLDQ